MSRPDSHRPSEVHAQIARCTDEVDLGGREMKLRCQLRCVRYHSARTAQSAKCQHTRVPIIGSTEQSARLSGPSYAPTHLASPTMTAHTNEIARAVSELLTPAVKPDILVVVFCSATATGSRFCRSDMSFQADDGGQNTHVRYLYGQRLG